MRHPYHPTFIWTPYWGLAAYASGRSGSLCEHFAKYGSDRAVKTEIRRKDCSSCLRTPAVRSRTRSTLLLRLGVAMRSPGHEEFIEIVEVKSNRRTAPFSAGPCASHARHLADYAGLKAKKCLRRRTTWSSVSGSRRMTMVRPTEGHLVRHISICF
jgi:hypothetical protein